MNTDISVPQDGYIDKSETHYVLLIHGTYNAPEEGQVKWYQLDKNNSRNFCKQLNDRLSHTAMGPAVWRSYENGRTFSWSGENDHEQRLKASKELCNEIIRLVNRDPHARIHFVAHSHGGNVLLNAIDLYYKYLETQAKGLFKHLIEEGEAGELPEKAFAKVYPELGTGVPETWKQIVRKQLETLQQSVVKVYPKLGTDTPEFSKQIGWKPYSLLLKFLFDRPRRKRRFSSVLKEKKKELVRNWITSKASNRIGRIVFLGTPFFRKLWIVPRLSWIRFLRDVPSKVRILPGYAVIFYVVILGYGFFLGLTPWLPILDWKPWNWPLWLLEAWFLLTLATFFSESSKQPRYNTNTYFDSKYLNSILKTKESNEESPTAVSTPSFSEDCKIPALVITAKYLDEALLALSSESFVYANLLPQIDKLLYFEQNRWICRILRLVFTKLGEFLTSKQEKGKRSSVQTTSDTTHTSPKKTYPIIGIDPAAIKPSYGWLKELFTAIYYLSQVWILWTFLRRFIVKPLLINILLRTVCGTAYGLSAEQLSGARVSVENGLNLPEFFNETPWDITSTVLVEDINKDQTEHHTSSITTKTTTRKSKPYAHIFEPTKLKEKMEAKKNSKDENTWKRIEHSFSDIYTRYKNSLFLETDKTINQKLAKEKYKEELAMIWFTFEDRKEEIVGSIELIHSLYYSNDRVINSIAYFLEKGFLPPGENSVK